MKGREKFEKNKKKRDNADSVRSHVGVCAIADLNADTNSDC